MAGKALKLPDLGATYAWIDVVSIKKVNPGGGKTPAEHLFSDFISCNFKTSLTIT
jgi:hypothetical protein